MATMLSIALFSLLSFWCGQAGAQSARALHVVVDGLSKQAGACGIEASSIESAAERTLRARGIRVLTSMASPYSYLYIGANVKMLRRGGEASPACMVHARVEVVGVSPTQAPVGGFKGAQPRRNTVEAILCATTGTSRGSPRDMGARFAVDLGQRIERCLANVI